MCNFQDNQTNNTCLWDVFVMGVRAVVNSNSVDSSIALEYNFEVFYLSISDYFILLLHQNVEANISLYYII